ncbi:MAG TPA: methionyl-tRNA formyltransferase [Thermoanaerobaculia bacterium]|nr:methionyl-tRNA formyltransferase [Thermoanaerobaculia bacterium]
MRIVFFGTPEFAVPSLDAIARGHEIALVVAQPDKPSGRGMKMHAPPVIVRARELGLPTAQPPKIRSEEFLASVAALKPDAGVVVAYGRILPAALLQIPFYNVHGSVLPKYRGAAPIQRAIEHGDAETGVTIMRVDEELDHGPILLIETTPIGPDEHTPQLAERLSHIGADTLARVLRGGYTETPQDHAKATFAPKIEKQEGEVRFEERAQKIYNRFRAFDPWPGVFHGDLKFTDIRATGQPGNRATPPGTILTIDDAVTISCGEGALRILELQRPGKPRTPAAALARGLGWRAGDVL